MFIIFDLDDTLVATSAYLTPFKLKLALISMQGDEEVKDFDLTAALERLYALNHKAMSASDALRQFAKERGFSSEVEETGIAKLHEWEEDLPVFPTEGANQVLFSLRKQHTLALVSQGKAEYQLFKLKKAGMDTGLFYKILFLEKGSKKTLYQSLLEEGDFLPSQVVVVGDRIPRDLTPAKDLGCWTVHVKQGRGLYSEGEGVDFTITTLPELQGVLEEIENKNMCSRGCHGK